MMAALRRLRNDSMLICYKDKNFGKKNRAIIEIANRYVQNYAAQGLSLTLRQLYYRFVADGLLPNHQRVYKNLGNVINDARLAGKLSWTAIEDRGRNLIRASHWDCESDIVDACAASFRVDRWEGQPNRVEVWVEKQALEAVVGNAATPLDCPYFACKGYTSQSEMWRAAQRMQRYVNAGQQPVIIHLGDHDPSGVDMTRDIRDRLNDLFGVDVKVDRIALSMAQIRKYNPPPNPAKLSDSRAKDYIRKFGDESWELDALEPSTLHAMIQGAIKRRLDRGLYEQMVREEEVGRNRLRLLAENYEEVRKILDET